MSLFVRQPTRCHLPTHRSHRTTSIPSVYLSWGSLGCRECLMHRTSSLQNLQGTLIPRPSNSILDFHRALPTVLRCTHHLRMFIHQPNTLTHDVRQLPHRSLWPVPEVTQRTITIHPPTALILLRLLLTRSIIYVRRAVLLLPPQFHQWSI